VIDAAEVERLATDLRHAERSATPVELLTDQHPDLSWDDARAVARATDRLRADEGDTMLGYKLGWTSAAMRDALGIDRPNWGTLWNSQLADDGLVTHELIHPKIEPELVYRVPASAVGVVPVGPQEVAGWNGEWALGIEVVDPRFRDYGFRWLDNTADNSSAARVVIGSFAMIDTVDLGAVTVDFSDGYDVRRGVGANALGNPCAAVAWLARSLRAEGTGLVAGQVVFTGGLTAPFDVRAGETYTLSSPHLPPAHIIARAD
jgi:2-keto-4-pentenoate hydratase